MKKFILILILIITIFLDKNSVIFASTLQNVDFNSKTDFWNTFYNACSTSSSGLTCEGVTDAVNTIYFPSLKCISSNFTSNGGPNQLFILDKNTDFTSYVVMYIQKGKNLEMNSNLDTKFDSGIISPNSGIHKYTLCKNSDIYTTYVDNTLVQSHSFPGHIGGYIGFQTTYGEYLTNFIATDKLPNLSNTTILYSNDFTSSFWNTFFSVCTTSNSGLTCPNTSVLNTHSFPTVKCISGNFDSSEGNPQLLLSEDPYLKNLITENFNSNSDLLIKDISNNYYNTGFSVPTGAHKYGICQSTNQIQIYIDNSKIYTFDTIVPHLNYIGFTLYKGSTLTNFTATDTFPENTVPLLKQTDPAWGTQTYDGAENWDPQHKTIGDWGCAMTSAAMVLKSHGINKLPDGTELDPGTLNTWLINQSDGYIDGVTSGYMNPLAITRLAKQAISVNHITNFDALEYQHISGADKTHLTDDLNNSQADMLEEPGHFIVATAVNGNTFDINDPYYDRKNLNEGYNNTFLSLNRYIPSHTDLSYILMTVNPNITVTVKDQNGQTVGDQFTQQPYSDPLNNNHPGGTSIKMIFVQKPATGNYQTTLSGTNDQNYQLHTYLYDKNGNVNTSTSQGTVGTNKSDSLTVTFNNQDSTKSIATRIVTFQSFIDDINENVQLHQINKNIGNALIPLISSAQDSPKRNQKLAAKLKLDAIELAMKALRNKGISESAFRILFYDEQYLKNHL